jgi:hypothetical protein
LLTISAPNGALASHKNNDISEKESLTMTCTLWSKVMQKANHQADPTANDEK